MGRLICKKTRNSCLSAAKHPPHERCKVQLMDDPTKEHLYLYGKMGQSTIMNPYVANNTIVRQGDLGSGSTELYSKKRRARGQPTADFHKKLQRAQIYHEIMVDAAKAGDHSGRGRLEETKSVDPRNPGISFVPYQTSLSWQQAARRGKFM